MSDLETTDRDANGDATERVNVDYIKGSLFRTIAPSGLIASPTPQGQIQVAFFSERQAIPQRVVYKLNPDGSLGDKIEIVSRDAIVRELDIAVTLDPETVEGLVRLLVDLMQDTKVSGEKEKTK